MLLPQAFPGAKRRRTEYTKVFQRDCHSRRRHHPAPQLLCAPAACQPFCSEFDHHVQGHLMRRRGAWTCCGRCGWNRRRRTGAAAAVVSAPCLIRPQSRAVRALAPFASEADAAAAPRHRRQPHSGRGLQPIQGETKQRSKRATASHVAQTALPQHGLGGGQSTLDVVEHSLHNRFDSLTRAGARLPPLPQQHTSPAQPSSSSPSSRHAIHNPSPPPLQQSSSSPKRTPSSASRLPTSASQSPAAMLQSAAAALADIRKSGTAAAISER